MHEPDGYPAANDFVIDAAADSNGMLVPFCRVKPGDKALAEAQRALGRGAKGIKLHPAPSSSRSITPTCRSCSRSRTSARCRC